MLSNEQRQQWECDGYFTVPQLLPEKDFLELDRMADRLIDGELKPEYAYRQQQPEELYRVFETAVKGRTDLPLRERTRLVSWMSFYHSYFAKLARHPAIYRIMAELFQDGVRLFSDTVFAKPARHGMEATMHQDTAFWPKLAPNAINVWLAIDPATVANGCLYMIPGTHHADIAHTPDPIQSWILTDDQVEMSRVVPIELPPNAAVIFDSAVVHRSYPNRSESRRRCYAPIYVAEHVHHVQPWKNPRDLYELTVITPASHESSPAG